MQQLGTSKQIVEAEQKYKRMGKGRVIAHSRKVYRLVNTDVFYVESESSNDTYYFVKYKHDVLEWCSCMDNSSKHKKCKHLFAIEFAIKWGTLRDTDKLPTDVKRDIQSVALQSKSYKDDDYSF